MKKINKFILIAFMSVIGISTASAQCSASFTYADNGAGDFSFTNTSTSPGANLYSVWDFGDGSSAWGQNLNHTYNYSGVYSVCLTITDTAFGGTCTSTYCDSIIVTGTGSPCNSTIISYDSIGSTFFSTLGSNGTSNGSTYFWDFGDGTTAASSVSSGYSHQYLSNGTYYYCVIIDSCPPICDSITISYNPPCNLVAGISYVDNGSGNYTFTSTSTGNVVNDIWSFGDGSSANGNSSNHTFAANGTYVVSLLSSDSNAFFGCYDYALVTIVVSGVIAPVACQAGFTVFTDSLTSGVNVINSSTGTNLTYVWNFGDGNGSTQQYPNYTYNSAGPFLLCLTVTDSLSGGSCSSTYCDSIGSNGIVFKGAAGFTINVIAPGTVGIDEVENVSNFNVFPNPVKNNVNIEFNLVKNSNVEVFVTDLLGNRVALVISENMTSGNNKANYNVSDIANGIYLLNIKTENSLQVKKIVVNK